jgi:hypothetical protein
MSVTTNYVDFTNAEATWRIYTHCADGVGPGYVSRVAMRSNGRLLVDPAGYQNLAPGLGRLVFDGVRAAQYARISYGAGGNVYVMDGGHCATSSSDRGVNNAASGPLNGTPTIWNNNTLGTLDELVVLQDEQSSALTEILYRWQISEHYVKLWADVVDLCNGAPNAQSQSCGPTPAWLKGPRFVATLNGHPDAPAFTQVTTWNAATSSPLQVCNSNSSNPATGAGPCQQSSRARVQFNYATPTGLGNAGLGANPACTATQRCFNAIFRNYKPDAACTPCITPGEYLAAQWYMGVGGLDDWARAASTYQRQGTDSSACSAQMNPSDGSSRSWEGPGYKTETNGDGTLDYRDSYYVASGSFWAWRNCINPDDNPSLFVAHTPHQWGVYAAFSFNYASVDYWAATMNG